MPPCTPSRCRHRSDTQQGAHCAFLLPCECLSLFSRMPRSRSGSLARVLADAEDDEFGRFHGSNANLDDHAPRVPLLHCVELLVALDVEGLTLRQSEERSVPPDTRQERNHVARDFLPRVEIVWLENHPLRAVVDRFLDEIEEATYVHVAPRRVAGQRARAPHANASPGERPDAVDRWTFRSARVENHLLALTDVALQTDCAAHDF